MTLTAILKKFDMPGLYFLGYKMPLQFVFVRHGQAMHNKNFSEVGESAFTDPRNKDAELTELGHQQTLATGTLLQSKIGSNVIAVWCSPLTRCIETMQNVIRPMTVKGDIHLHDSLIECLGGNHVCNDRQIHTTLSAKYPDYKMNTLPEYPPHWRSRENRQSMRQRMWMLTRLLLDIYYDSDEESDGFVLIVSHHDAIEALTGKSLNNAEALIYSVSDLINI
jgi:broad specificity phosphatase PhoE